MALTQLTNHEIALHLARSLRAWRVSPTGAGMTQAALEAKSGVSGTSLKRFEKTGAITLRNLIALMRALGLVDRFEDLVPPANFVGPIARLEAEQAAKAKARQRAPRK
ncbi:MAG: helix-turn-helix transcriptional regulator [Burkholderiaceae bacterium]|nr:helix-turn-helix transcriptional regulator [Burkholderiaceae bacterium]